MGSGPVRSVSVLMRGGRNCPGVARVGRHAGRVAGAEAGAAAVAELLRGHGLMAPDAQAPDAQAPDVAVVVSPALCEGQDMVGNRGRLNDAALNAEAADWLGSETALALLDTCATAQPISHHGPQTQEEPQPLRARLFDLHMRMAETDPCVKHLAH